MALDNRNKKPTADIKLDDLQPPVAESEEIIIPDTQEEYSNEDYSNDNYDNGDNENDISDNDSNDNDNGNNKVQRQTEVEDKPEPIDYKEKFRESSREALALHFKNEKLINTIDEASQLTEPTEKELQDYAKELGAEYDDLDTFSQNIIKKNLLNERRFETINKVNKEYKNVQEWVNKVDDFMGATETIAQYPEIVDNADEFRKFSLKQSRRGADLQDLATAFLYGLGKNSTQKKKGSMLMSGNRGNPTPQEKRIDERQVASLRQKNPKEYRRLIKMGKIKLDI